MAYIQPTELLKPLCPLCRDRLTYSPPYLAYICENPRCNWGGQIGDNQLNTVKERRTYKEANEMLVLIDKALDRAGVNAGGSPLERIEALVEK